MSTKLTLTIDKSVIDKAKKFAKASGRSLSDIVESYLKKLVAPLNESDEEVPEELKELFGSVKIPHDLDEKKAMRDIMFEKHHE